MTIDEGLNKLFSLHSFGVKLGLENITSFLNILGNPQHKFKTFHIAGSNGKGSTAAFTASILKEFGYRTGLYTSPHFIKFNERIKVNGIEIPDQYVVDFISEYEQIIDKTGLTFFEVTTALAFKFFADQKVDYAVIETGLGGRLDATNVLNPGAVIITSISLEHTAILGDTIEQIASEKAGILKNNSIVFTGIIPTEADQVIEKKCIQTGSDLFRLEDYLTQKHNTIELYTEEIEIDEWNIPLKGDYQKNNAALAVLAVSKILDENDFNPVQAGLRNVIKNTGINGRYEYFHRDPDIIFDSAHNPESVLHFVSEFKKDYRKYNHRTLLFGAMKDKAIKQMLLHLAEYFDETALTHVNNERACTIEELKSIADELNLIVTSADDHTLFVRNFLNSNPGNCLVVLGSMYLLGEIKTSLQVDKIA